jgi:hypothetical protein
MASELKFLIDNLDRGQPLNPEDFGINITEDDTIGARIVSFDNELIFGGDVFGYLYNKLATSGYCELVRVQVQYLCESNGIWERLVDGYIIATECNFILDRCQVKTKLYDETFSTKINNNKGIPFSLLLTKSKNGTTITPPSNVALYVFNPNVNYYPDPAYGYTVYDVFKHLVACMSDGLIDFDSNYFAATYPQNDVLFYTNGESIRIKNNTEVLASFQDLYAALRSKLNLGMGFEKQTNGRPLLRIELSSYFQQSTQSANLYDQSDIEMQFDTSRLFQAADFGNDLMLEAGQCDNGNTSCEFIQTPFRGFRSERFGFVGECNTSNILQLKTSEIIFDTNLIQDIVVFNNEGYDTNGVVIMTNWTGVFGVGTTRARQFDPYGIGNQIYNGTFTNEYVSANWLAGYPNSLQSFFQAFDPAQTNFYMGLGVAQALLNQVQYDETAYVSIESYTSHWAYYYTTVINPFSYFNLDTYTVPFTGIYTFNAGLIFEAARDSGGANPIDPNNFGRDRKILIQQYDSAGAFVSERVVSNSGSSNINAWSEINNAIFVCNQGDKIRVNAEVKRSTGTGFFNIQRFLDSATINSIARQSYFTGIGVPFAPTTLQPVDINDVQAYLYKFKRPLSMTEINAITSETSKPILLGRKEDSLAVTPTYIKNIQIESVMRKGAQFELRSNKLLP